MVLLSFLSFDMTASGINSNISANAAEKDFYTVVSDGDYYSETTYYFNKISYHNYLRKENLEKKAVNVQALPADEENKTFVSATNKRIWVSEMTDESGVVTDSRLLSKTEIESIASRDNDIEPLSAQTQLDTCSRYNYRLDINLTLFYDESNDEYIVKSFSSWVQEVVGAWETETSAEEFHKDCIAITWGGEETIHATESEISGRYYNGNLVNFAYSQSNSLVGYAWQFFEKSGYLGRELREANAEIVLKKYGALVGKKTNVIMTYIHTYGAVNGNLTFGVNGNGELAASVSLELCEKQWQIEADCFGINY